MKQMVMMLAVATTVAVNAGTTYYSDGKGCTNGSMPTNLKWYTDDARTVLAEPQPTPTENDDNTYVFVTSMKFDTGPTFPVGTHVCFGTPDGKYAFFPNCSSGTWNIPDGTVYGLTFKPNWNYTGVWKGNYRLVKTSKSIIWGACSLTDNQAAGNNPYGETLAGTFTGESDVLVQFVAEYGSGNQCNGICRTVISGDFSGYKGKFATVAVETRAGCANLGYLDLRFSSPSAFGDANTPATDALTLRHRAQLSLTDDVVQSTSRGITFDLSATQYAGLRAESGKSWTLTAPTYGANGEVRKTGAGTVTLAGNLSVTNLVVAEGTLVLGEGSTFAEGTKLVIRSGATVLVNRSAGLSGFAAVEKEEGGVLKIPVQYDAATLTAVPLELDEVTVSAVPWPLGIELTENLALPVNESTNVCVARIAADCSRTFTADDFVLTNAKVCDLPKTGFEIVKDAEQRTCVYLTIKAAISQTGQRWGIVSRSVSGGTEYTWSDHQGLHPGADYYCLASQKSYNGGRTKDGSNIASFDFTGDSMTMQGKGSTWQTVSDYAGVLTIPDLRLGSLGSVNFVRASSGEVWSGGERKRRLSGVCTILPDATLQSPAVVIVSNFAEPSDSNEIDADLKGTGTLRLQSGKNTTGSDAPIPFKVYGRNESFMGRLHFYSDSTTRYMEYAATNGANFGGSPATLLADAVRLAANSSFTDPKLVVVRADKSLTADAPNRGWTVVWATLRAPEGVTFTLKSPLRVESKLVKDGAGTLALGCQTTTAGKGNAFEVEEGYLMPLTADCCAPLAVTFDDGAGIELDAALEDAVVRTKGLVAQSLTLAGKLKVTMRNWKDCGETDVKRAILSVPSTTADLTDSIELVGRGAVKELSKETVGDVTTYFANFSRSGLTIFLK